MGVSHSIGIGLLYGNIFFAGLELANHDPVQSFANSATGLLLLGVIHFLGPKL